MNNNNEALLKRYKQQYFGKAYQWTRPINNEKVGETVRVVDVKMRGNMTLLVFNAGTPVNVELINNHLREVGGGDIPPPPGMGNNADAPGGGPIPIPEELSEYRDENKKKPISFSSNETNQQSGSAPKKKSDLFALFQSEEKSINLPIKIKMPEIALVKMMYDNAADKDKFLTELAEYVIDGINVDTVKNAVKYILNPEPANVPDMEIVIAESDEENLEITEVRDETNEPEKNSNDDEQEQTPDSK